MLPKTRGNIFRCASIFAILIAGIALSAPAQDAPLTPVDSYCLKGNGEHSRKIIWSPNAATIAAINTDSVQLWNIDAEGAQKGPKIDLNHLNNRGSTPVAYSPDGKYLAAAGGDAILRIYSVDDDGFTLLTAAEGHDHEIFSVTFSHDGKTILTGDGDMAVLIWDFKDGRVRQRDMIKITKGWLGVKYLGFAPDDSRFTLTTGTGDVNIVDLVDGRPRLAANFKEPAAWFEVPMAVSPVSGRLLLGSQKDARIWSENNSIAWNAHDDYITAVAWSPDAKYFATAGADGRLILWTADGKTRYSIQRPSKFLDVKFAPAANGLWLAALNDNGDIYLFHYDTPHPQNAQPTTRP